MCFQIPIKKTIEEIFTEEIKNYKYGLIFTLDKPYFGELTEIDYKYSESNFIEARFFNTEKELFVFYDGEKYKAVETDKSKWNKEDTIDREYILDSKFQEKNYIKNDNIKYIQVIEFIDYDDDGQAYVKASCLHNIKVGEN